MARSTFSTLLAALVISGLLAACGRAKDSSNGGTGDGNPDGDAGRSHANRAHGGANSVDADAGSGEPGGGPTEGTSGAGGASAQAGAGGNGFSTGGSAQGTGATAGAGGAFMGTASDPNNPFPLVGTGEPVNCDVPAVPAGDTAAAKERATLIEKHCSVLADYPCLENFDGEASRYAGSCAAKVRVAACELDDTLDYNQRIPVACDDAWHASVDCANSVDYTGACDLGGGSSNFPLGLIPIVHYQSPGYMGEPCRPERQALQDCIEKQNPASDVKGQRVTCRYYTAVNDPGVCDIFCDAGNNEYFESECDGVSGGPYECGCRLNGVPLSDDAFGYNPRFFGASCADAAQRMADGECIERVDCCFTWMGVQGKSGCACVSDPKLVGYDTCAAAAAATGGTVVDLCPRYQLDLGGLNIARQR